MTPLRLDEYPYLSPSGNQLIQPDFDSKFSQLDTQEQVRACVRLAKEAGHDFLVLDQTRPDIGVPVVRVVVPDYAISIAASRPAVFTTCR